MTAASGGDGWLDGYDGSWGSPAPAPAPAPTGRRLNRRTVEVLVCPACWSTDCRCTHRQAGAGKSRWQCGQCAEVWLEPDSAGGSRAWLA